MQSRREAAVAASTAGPSTVNAPRQRLSKLGRSLSSRLDGLSWVVAMIRKPLHGIPTSRILVAALIMGVALTGLLMLPLDELLKAFLMWLKNDVGPWGPFIMAFAYIPLTVLALPASILTLGGGYLFGLSVGFAADSIGSTIGATAAFLVGKTFGRSFVAARLKDFPQFQAIATAISKSGFKIVLLLRLVPIIPFNLMNYILSVTPISIGSFIMASFLGNMPCTFAFVYIGTTIKDISEIGTPGSTMGPAQWWMLGTGLLLTVIGVFLITRFARDALLKAIDEHDTSKQDPDVERRGGSSQADEATDVKSKGKAGEAQINSNASRVESSGLPPGHRREGAATKQ